MGKSIEEKFQEQELKLGLLSKGLIDVIWVVDLEAMRYTYISPSVEKIRGFSVEEVRASPVKNQMTEESYVRVLDAMADGLREYQTNLDVKRTVEVEMLHKDGGTVWFEITARLAKERNGTIKAVGVTKDISLRKAHELEREKLIGDLEAALEEQKRLRQELKILRGLLPICAECKRIRDEDGKWWPIEDYIASRTEAHFTHTICPDCKDRALAEFKKIV